MKILEAMALNRPVVSTTLGCEGLEAVDGKHLLIADDAGRFAEQVICMLKSVDLRQRIAKEARRFVVAHYDWDVISEQLIRVYDKVTDGPS